MSYLFDPDFLHQTARSVIDRPITEMIPAITRALASEYPGHILPEASHRWILNNAGGAMGSMLVLHASLTEYIIIFGTPIGTEGHSGRYWAKDYFMILDGEQWSYSPGDLEREVYKPGDLHVLPPGTAQGYRIPDRCWALEYARGFIPAMLPFGLMDTLTSTLDVRSLLQTMWVYGHSTARELLRGKI
jgi:C-8 sterol isomerase